MSAVALHFWATVTGLYDTQLTQGLVWFDNVLHAFVGIAFALVWFATLERFKPTAKLWVRAASTLLFVAAAAAAWELFELGFYLFFKTHALGLKVYSPSLREAFFDSISNVAGACLLLTAFIARRG